MQRTTKLILHMIFLSPVWGFVNKNNIKDDGEQVAPVATASESSPISTMEKLSGLLGFRALQPPVERKNLELMEQVALEKHMIGNAEIVYERECTMVGDCHLDFVMVVLMVVAFAICAFAMGYELTRLLYRRDTETTDEEWTPAYSSRHNSPRNHGV